MTRRRVITAWVVITVLLALLHVTPISLILKCRGLDCGDPGYQECWESYITTWPWIRACVQSFVPACFMFVANIIIIVKLAQRNQKRRKMCSNVPKNNSTTIMLLLVSFAFVILTPSNALYNTTDQIFNSYVLIENPKTFGPTDAFCAYIGRHLLYLNSAINFFLYCASGTKFRRYDALSHS
jgi:anaerobic C4-dicarboxylate transporter